MYKMSLRQLRVAQPGMARRASTKFKLQMCNGYLRVAQDRWRGATARELVQKLVHSIGENGFTSF
ncbi:hypothetical protein A2U01_0086415, partial [Trifolium medium]|nr:hypothetical protein [Trifolium medium]